MRSPIGVVLILCGLALTYVGCAPDAPHDNPLDPMSPNYKNSGGLTGRVLTISLPYGGVPNVLVTIEQNGSSQLTGADGSFDFPDAPSGSITLVVAKPAFLADTVYLNLPVGGNIDTLLHIDALPQIADAKVVTTKIDQWWPGPVYSASVSANVTDPDGMGDLVDSTVRVQVDSLSFKMNYSGSTGSYGVIINASQLPGQDLQWLVGKQFFISATDRENATASTDAFYVSRIVESEPVPSSPKNLDTTSAYPTFEWNPPPVSYGYTYFLQVYQINAGTPTQMGPSISLPFDSLSYRYPDSLVAGQYFWTIGMVDDYGNSARSTEASFLVP